MNQVSDTTRQSSAVLSVSTDGKKGYNKPEMKENEPLERAATSTYTYYIVYYSYV